jgi:hypothetical protein
MFSRGLKATDLIKLLEEAVEKHGDLEVYAGGGDYPEGVNGVSYITPKTADGYRPENSLFIW